MPAQQVAAGLLLVVAVGSAVGCGRSPDAVERARVLAAIDALRDAPSVDTVRRRGLLEELERQPAAAPAAKLARDRCASAYRHLFDGDDRRAELQRGATSRADLPQKLAEAEADLAQARTAMNDCERALADLRRPGAARPPGG